MDVRNQKLAKVLIEHSLEVKKGDKVVISTSDLSPIDLTREVLKQILKKGAFVYLDVMGWNWILGRSSYGDLVRTYLDNANLSQIKKIPDVYKSIIDWGDKFVRITTLDNYAHLAGVNSKKMQEFNKANRKEFHRILDERAWILTYYPTPSMAQQAGISEETLKDFYFNACLVDYKKMKAYGDKIMKIMDKAKVVHLVGEKTDLYINVEGNLAENAYGKANMPDGEVYIAPVYQKTEGYIYYDLPNYKDGVDVTGIYLEFKKGKVVKASAEQGEAVLKRMLSTDKGARYLGELGLGINYGITKPMRNTLFDEKIGGTIHTALGKAYKSKRGGAPKGGNESAIHWDIVKDMRKKGSYIEVDGKVVFKEGKWLV